MTFIASDAILLVEDDRVLRLLTLNLLEEADYWVLYAKNTEEAWGIFHEQWPVIDLPITAAVLPGRGGFELTLSTRGAKSRAARDLRGDKRSTHTRHMSDPSTTP